MQSITIFPFPLLPGGVVVTAGLDLRSREAIVRPGLLFLRPVSPNSLVVQILQHSPAPCAPNTRHNSTLRIEEILLGTQVKVFVQRVARTCVQRTQVYQDILETFTHPVVPLIESGKQSLEKL